MPGLCCSRGLKRIAARASLALRVFAETDGEACVQAFAMDRAGNETRLGPTVCEIEPVVVEEEDEEEDEEELDDRGCACASTGTSSSWGLVVLVLGVRRRAPCHPHPSRMRVT